MKHQTKPGAATSNMTASAKVEFADNGQFSAICGPLDAHLKLIENTLKVSLQRSGAGLIMEGAPKEVADCNAIIEALKVKYDPSKPLDEEDVKCALRFAGYEISQMSASNDGPKRAISAIITPLGEVHPRSPAQAAMIGALKEKPLIFGTGPAGTGKTYLAVAAAVEALFSGRVERIILSRPAVEAGERIGFLPGAVREKFDPYMQPLYDALGDCIKKRQLEKYYEDNTIEIAPLAFMRGRTLSRAYIVLDEAQNATRRQMKMFLTRLGQGAQMAITGDETQIDLPASGAGAGQSGFGDAIRRLGGLQDVAICRFSHSDVVRHPLVSAIIKAYE